MLQDLYLSLGGAAPAWYRDPLVLHVLMAAAAQWPLLRLLRRAGLRPYWALLMFVPLAGPALAGSALVFQRWPNLPPAPKRRRRR